MNDKAILCSRNTATRLAGVLDIMGNQVIETEFGFHVNKGQDSEVYLKYSKNHKDSIEAVMLLNKLLPVSDGLQGLLGVALSSFMECLAIVLAENETDTTDIAYIDELQAAYVAKFYCSVDKIRPIFKPGNLIKKWKEDLGF